ncbi:hypothetical protein ACFVUS_05820 [Nocardia sp. NPDC058058]|uniref:hypothetical protein n=1 Tax=Nocardia sp. NPDC058058 TaxID=3346317 RepID=UPI0036DAF0F1
MYEVLWVADALSTSSISATPIKVPNATRTINDMVSKGWELHSIVPGTNAQTYSGLFLTFKRD